MEKDISEQDLIPMIFTVTILRPIHGAPLHTGQALQGSLRWVFPSGRKATWEQEMTAALTAISMNIILLQIYGHLKRPCRGFRGWKLQDSASKEKDTSERAAISRAAPITRISGN